MTDERVKQQCFALADFLKRQMLSAEIGKASDLARLSGVSPQSLSRLLDPKPLPDTGKYHLPRRDTILKLARPLGVGPDEILAAAGYTASYEVPDAPLISQLLFEYYELVDEDQEALRATVEMLRAEVHRRLAIRRRGPGVRVTRFFEVPELPAIDDAQTDAKTKT